MWKRRNRFDEKKNQMRLEEEEEEEEEEKEEEKQVDLISRRGVWFTRGRVELK